MNSEIQTEYINVGQLSSYLGWSPRFIDGLVRGEHLPGIKIDGEWKFRRDEVVSWLERKIQTLDAARIAELEKKLESSLFAEGHFRTHRTDRLASRLPLDGIALDLPVETKPEVLRTLASLADATGNVTDKDHLLASLIDRESLHSTGLPGGVAICHPRRPIPSVIRQQFLCFLRAAEPVDFAADDGGETKFFFLLCAPDDRSHLHGIARLARILHRGALGAMQSANSPQQVIAALAAAEANI